MKSFLLLFLFFTATLHAQFTEPKYDASDATLPDWVRMMYAERSNLFQVEDAYRHYYSLHPFVKNTYTQYFKRWHRYAKEHLDEEGFVRTQSTEERELLQNEILARKNSPAQFSKSNTAGWRFIGPKETHSDGPQQTKITWQANIYGLDQSLSNPDILFASGETGGLYKSTDHGMNWMLANANINTGSIRAISIHPFDPSIVYVGGSSKIYKTTNGGADWQGVFSLGDMWAHDMVINPADPRIVIAATNKGLLRTSDGGSSWALVVQRECWTVRLKSDDPNVVYAVCDSSSTSLFLKSTDRGATFTVKTTGWYQPTSKHSIYGVRIAVTPADPNRIYALIGADGDIRGYVGVFVSYDAGESWRHPHGQIGPPYEMPAHPNLGAHDGKDGFYQGFYDFAIAASPRNADQIIVGGTSWWKSVDGAKTYQALGSYVGGLPWSHPDMQWLHARGDELWICSDGGINYSTDFAQSIEARMNGIAGSDFWGFDAGWNEDVLVGGRYHNGNTAYYERYPDGKFLRLGGGEAATGYVNPGENRRTYFSDIGGWILPDSMNGALRNFAVGKFPNESYYFAEFSEMAFDPRCFNIVYIGNGNKLLKSADGAASYEEIFASSDAGAMIEHIEIPRCNPNVIYASQRSNSLYDGKIWKTTNAGTSWNVCAAVPASSGSARRVMTMSVSATNEQELWIALLNGGANEKVFRTTDGGATWLNMTTAMLKNLSISYIQMQYGTNSGVYIATLSGEVFYRNSTMNDWQSHSVNLPVGLTSRILRPFYKKGLLRSGSNMGVWETELYEASKPVAQISVDKLTSACVRDTFYFEDHSVLHENGASWLWSFPGASYVSSVNARNPRVVYPDIGKYAVSLTVTNVNGSDTQRLNDFIEIAANECVIDTLADRALDLKPKDNAVETGTLGGLAGATGFTFTAWIKPASMQQSFTQIVSNWNSEAGFAFGFAFIGYTPNTNLIFSWKNVPYWLTTPFNLDTAKWSHVAITIEPTKAILYHNGNPWEYKGDFSNFNFASTPFTIGGGHPTQGGNFNGEIDEVKFYNRALTRNEVREKIHLIIPKNEDALVGYFQFNESDGNALDRTGVAHARIVGAAPRMHSTIPVATGSSERFTVDRAGTYDIASTGISLLFDTVGVASPKLPRGELVAYRLNALPAGLPDSSLHFSDHYWIVRNFGLNPSINTLKSISFHPVTPIINSGTLATDLRLFNRASSAFVSADWDTALVYGASELNAATTFVSFDNVHSLISSLGQFTIGTDSIAIEVSVQPLSIPSENIDVYPNPATRELRVLIRHEDRSASFEATLIDPLGRIVASPMLRAGENVLSLEQLDRGMFVLVIRTPRGIVTKRIQKAG